jgi:hypothetical protein
MHTCYKEQKSQVDTPHTRALQNHIQSAEEVHSTLGHSLLAYARMCGIYTVFGVTSTYNTPNGLATMAATPHIGSLSLSPQMVHWCSCPSAVNTRGEWYLGLGLCARGLL